MKNVIVLLVLLGIVVAATTADAQILFTASLDGSQETPPVVTTGKGTAWAVLSADMKTLTYRMTYARLSTARTGAHFHAGGTGGGVVVFPLSFSGNTVSGTWNSVPDSIVRHLLKEDLYVNVHSSTSPGGEIRGYFHVAQGVGFTAAMDGSQESPANSSTGTGTAWVVLDSTGARLTHDVTVAGLSGPLTAAHYHISPAGSVVHPITFVDSTSHGTWTGFSDVNLTALTSGNLYLTVHTPSLPGGEIRGTVKYPATVLTGVEVVSQGSPTSFKLEQNYPNPFNPTTNIRFQLDKSSPVTLKVYSVIGQEVASLFQGAKEPGTYEISFDASALASGVYFYRLSTASGVSQARKMMLLK